MASGTTDAGRLAFTSTLFTVVQKRKVKVDDETTSSSHTHTPHADTSNAHHTCAGTPHSSLSHHTHTRAHILSRAHTSSLTHTRTHTHLHAEEGDGGEQVHGGLEVLEARRVRRGERVAVHGQVDAQRVVQLVQQLHELLLLQERKRQRQRQLHV